MSGDTDFKNVFVRSESEFAFYVRKLFAIIERVATSVSDLKPFHLFDKDIFHLINKPKIFDNSFIKINSYNNKLMLIPNGLDVLFIVMEATVGEDTFFFVATFGFALLALAVLKHKTQ